MSQQIEDWDFLIQKKIKKVFKHNDTVIDIGANTGTYTNFFKNFISEEGKIFCYDISEFCINILKSLQFPENIIIEHLAISNKDEKIKTFHGGIFGVHGCNIIGFNAAETKTELMGEVESKRLDSIFDSDTKIKLIKIDVEGAENMVLEGMEKIADNVELILLECHHQKDWKQTIEYINKYKFKVYDFQSNLILDELPENRLYQILLIKEDKLDHYKKTLINE